MGQIASFKAREKSHSSMVVAFIFAGGFINQMDRAVMGVLAPQIRQDLGLSTTEMGLVFSIFAVGYGLFTFIGGWATDRFGPNIVLNVSVAVWSALCALTGAATGLVSLLLVRFAFGAAESPWMPASSTMLASAVRQKNFASAFGIAHAGAAIGGVVTGPLIALSAAAFGWRLSFVLISLVGFVWCVGWWLAARTLKAARSRPDPAPLIILPKDISSPNLWSVLRQPAFIAARLSLAGVNYVLVFFLNWFPNYLVADRGLSSFAVGMTSAAPWTMAALGLGCGGLLSDHVSKGLKNGLAGPRLLVPVCLMPASLCLLLVPLLEGVTAAVILMSIAVGLCNLAVPNYFSAVNQMIPQHHLGKALGILVITNMLTSVVAPVLTGKLVDMSGDFTSSFLVTGGMAVTSVILFLAFVRLPGTRQE